jgi:TonB family protein
VRLPAIVVRPDGPAAALDPALAAGWAIATAIGLAWCAGGALYAKRRRRAWPETVVDGVPVRVSPSVGPAVVGLASPEVVLPRWALALPPSQRALVLAHERAHADARDPALLFAATALVWLAPWNPALWYVLARLHAAIELDCDARVLRAHPAPRAYASLLLDVSERALNGFTPLPMPPALVRSAPLLARRIVAMTTSSRRSRFTPLRVAGCAALTVTMAAAAAVAPRPVVAASRAPRSVRIPAGATRADTMPLYRETDVDTPVAPLSMQAPHYPDSLRAAKVEGVVLLQFVVDTAGRVEPGTVRALMSSNALFTRSATAALADARFKPAIKQGRPVRQTVQQPFQFAMKS